MKPSLKNQGHNDMHAAARTSVGNAVSSREALMYAHPSGLLVQDPVLAKFGRDDSSLAQRCRVLLVCEDSELKRTLLDGLEQLGIMRSCCDHARDMNEVMVTVEDRQPSLVLVDVSVLNAGPLQAEVEEILEGLPLVALSDDVETALDRLPCSPVDIIPLTPSFERLERAVARAMRARSRTESLESSFEIGQTWIIAQDTHEMAIIHHSDIILLQSQGKYTKVVSRDRVPMIRKGLGIVEQGLDPKRFIRIHRGTIVNADHAVGLRRDDMGRLRLRMRNHDQWLSISKQYEHHFKQF